LLQWKYHNHDITFQTIIRSTKVIWVQQKLAQVNEIPHIDLYCAEQCRADRGSFHMTAFDWACMSFALWRHSRKRRRDWL